MKKSFPLNKTLAALREMPVDISMEQVRQWVRKRPKQKVKPSWHMLLKKFLFSNN